MIERQVKTNKTEKSTNKKGDKYNEKIDKNKDIKKHNSQNQLPKNS